MTAKKKAMPESPLGAMGLGARPRRRPAAAPAAPPDAPNVRVREKGKRKGQAMVPRTIWLETSLDKRLRLAAVERDSDMSGVISAALEAYLAHE
jgi:hypothetical protein